MQARILKQAFSPLRRSLCSKAPQDAPHKTLAERCTKELEVRRSKLVAWAAPVDSEDAAFQFLDEVRDPDATHNCWAYKIRSTYRFSDDGEPGGTAGRPIYSSIEASGLNGVMVVVTRYYGGMNLGHGGLVRAYSGVSLDCLRGGKTVIVKPKVNMDLHLPFDLLGVLYPLIESYQVEKLREECDEDGENGMSMKVSVELERAKSFEEAVKVASSRRVEIKWQKE